MLISMAFVAVAEIIFYITSGIVTALSVSNPYKYVLLVMSGLAAFANAAWLYNIINEKRESMPPKRKQHRRKSAQPRHHRWWMFISVEACLSLVIYLFISNEVVVPWPVCLLVAVLGGFVSLLL